MEKVENNYPTFKTAIKISASVLGRYLKKYVERGKYYFGSKKKSWDNFKWFGSARMYLQNR